MDPQRLDEIACMLALLMLPAACSDAADATVGDSTADESTGGPTTSSDGSTTTTADGGSTGGDATAADATNDASTAGTSSGLGGSSSDSSSSEGTESSATADETTGSETGANVGPICEAYAQNIETCYPDRVDPDELGQQCEMWFDAYATHGQDCLDAADALFMCRAEASCQELERDACFPFLNTVVAECG